MLECAEVLNRQRKLILTNVLEEFQPQAVPTLGIYNPLLHIKMHQCVGVFTGTLPRSVMVKFVTNKARDVVLRKSELFRYSNFHHI